MENEIRCATRQGYIDKFGGSWVFIAFFARVDAWIVIPYTVNLGTFDKYPYILLNLAYVV